MKQTKYFHFLLLPLCPYKKILLMKITKKGYLQGFGIAVLMLALVRCAFPGVANSSKDKTSSQQDSLVDNEYAYAKSDSIDALSLDEKNKNVQPANDTLSVPVKSVFFNEDGSLAKHKIFSVPHFGHTFPDMNDIQLEAAKKWGVTPVENRANAEKRKKELVYVGSNPYFYIDKLHSSLPYLVPRASVLLQDIGRSFYDSLQIKGIPLHKIIITSVLRSKEDVSKLRSHNSNASQNSCHMYGTTFDLCYNRYQTVAAPGENRRKVQNDTLKWVLSEVLRDFRESNRCYVKYEVHQGCFHITVR